MTQVLSPAILRHVAALETSLNIIEFTYPISREIAKVTVKMSCHCILSIYYNIMSYWDIEAYLAEEQPTVLRFAQDAEGMAFLDTSKGISGTVPADSPLNASIWLAYVLRNYMYINESDELIRFEVPKFFQRDQNEGYYKSIENDRSAKLQSINLREKSIYFYKIYQTIHEILQQNKNLIEPNLIRTMLIERGLSIIERASMHQQEHKAEAKFNNYVELERKAYKTVRDKTLQYQHWECHKQQ